MEKTRICTKCKKELPIEMYSKSASHKGGYYPSCKVCVREANKKRYQANKEKYKEKAKEYAKNNFEKIADQKRKYHEKNYDKIQEYKKKYREQHRDELNQKQKKYYENNKEKVKEYQQKNKFNILKKHNEYIKLRKKDDVYRLKCNIRTILCDSFKRKKCIKKDKAEKILGCTIDQLIEHLKETYNARYHTEWDGRPVHIDHIIPLATAENEENVIKLCHWSNLQLLIPKDNLEKGAKDPEFLNGR